jgi:hypothetical protein
MGKMVGVHTRLVLHDPTPTRSVRVRRESLPSVYVAYYCTPTQSETLPPTSASRGLK